MSLNPVIEKAHSLLESQDYAVLCTGENQKRHGALVGYIYDQLTETLYFASANYTRKSGYLPKDSQVAMVVDNRGENPKISDIECVTVEGNATLIDDNKKEKVLNGLLTKHPYLKELLLSSTCEFYKVHIGQYQYVTRLQQVFKWKL